MRRMPTLVLSYAHGALERRLLAKAAKVRGCGKPVLAMS